MALSPGTRLGTYEILGLLGAGGMGEVYRARDTRLERIVALKVLPPHLSGDPVSRARLAREARAVASLGHRYICALYDVCAEGGVDFLVLELLEGESLETRLERGPLPLAQVLRLGTEVADALSQAHRKGLVHRDLKPANIMLTQGGAKLLDFGIARTLTPGETHQDTDATATAPLTAPDRIHGTLPYMSPEQIEGIATDPRSDIWSLGTTLYEAATGKRAFEGATPVALMASILKSEPLPMSQLRPGTPRALEQWVMKCLAKDPDERVQTAYDLLLGLQWGTEQFALDSGQERGGRPRLRPRLALAAGAVAAGVALGALWAARNTHPERHDPPLWLSVPAPADSRGTSSETQLSPDGRTLAFVLGGSLWIRSLTNRASTELRGAEGAKLPFWSPDSRRLGFFARGKLQTIALDGTPPREICEATESRGGAWSAKGVILFAPTSEGPLYRVRDTGGVPTPATRLDSSRQEINHRWPSFLPDGIHFLYTALPMRAGAYPCYVGSLESGAAEPLVASGCAPVFASPSHVIFLRDESLVAQRIDLRRRKLQGTPFVLCDLGFSTGQLAEPMASASNSGMLTIPNNASDRTSLRWSDRSGNLAAPLVTLDGRAERPAISADGTNAAVAVWRGPRRDADLWVVDLRRLVATRLTQGPGIARDPVWSQDGNRILYEASQGGHYSIYARKVAGPDPEELLYEAGTFVVRLIDWSPDGRFAVLNKIEPGNATDIWLLPTRGDRTPVPYLRTPADEHAACISPDGAWLAYASNETGRWGIYVESFPTPGDKYLVSHDRSFQMWWARDGSELFYIVGRRVFSIGVNPGTASRFAPPRPLFMTTEGTEVGAGPDGRRFLAWTRQQSDSVLSVQIVVNWAASEP